MSSIELTLASHTDDGALRAIMNETQMPGSISLAFRREPSYFLGSSVQGENPQVLVAREDTRQTIVGLAARLMKNVFVNGSISRCGYLCDLRIKGPFRRRLILSKGYHLLHELERADPVPFYLTVIYGQNNSALETLVGKRANLPHYRDWGRILTPAIFFDRDKRALSLPGVIFKRAAESDLEAILLFLTRELPSKQFSPSVNAKQLSLLRTRGLNTTDFYLATRSGRIVGAMAAWEQSLFRQVSVEGYPRFLAAVRPFYNSIAPLLSLRPLPSRGEILRFLYLSFVAIADNNFEIFRGLFRFLYRDLRKGPWSFCVAGLHEKDPLVEALDEYRKLDAYGNLFLVNYPEQEGHIQCIDSRIPYFEMACA